MFDVNVYRLNRHLKKQKRLLLKANMLKTTG